MTSRGRQRGQMSAERKSHFCWFSKKRPYANQATFLGRTQITFFELRVSKNHRKKPGYTFENRISRSSHAPLHVHFWISQNHPKHLMPVLYLFAIRPIHLPTNPLSISRGIPDVSVSPLYWTLFGLDLSVPTFRIDSCGIQLWVPTFSDCIVVSTLGIFWILCWALLHDTIMH